MKKQILISKLSSLIKEGAQKFQRRQRALKENYGISVDSQLINFIIDSIDLTGYNIETTSDDEKLREFYNIFIDENGWHVKQVGVKKALEDYLRGMPSSIDLPTYYNEVRNFLYAIGFNEVKDMEDDEVDDFYYKKLVEVILDYLR